MPNAARTNAELLALRERNIPHDVVTARAEGAYLWDVEGAAISISSGASACSMSATTIRASSQPSPSN